MKSDIRCTQFQVIKGNNFCFFFRENAGRCHVPIHLSKYATLLTLKLFNISINVPLDSFLAVFDLTTRNVNVSV